MSYSKLSIALLADAFAQEEGKRSGRVFAIFMNKETRRVLQGFLKALQTPECRWSDGDLWGATFVLDERIPSSNILLGVLYNDGPHADDFTKALDFFTTGAVIPEAATAPAPVWSTILALF